VSVVVVGLNHRTAPLGVLERLNVAPALVGKALHELAACDHLSEVVVLSTCNRTEIHAVATRYHPAMLDVRNFLSGWSGDPPEAFADHCYSYHDDSAVTHLFRVASGLDSAVLGEGEILRQTRDAWASARAEGTSGPVLDLLFRQAIETGKRVRAETGIARGITSLAHAAVDLASERVGGLEGRTVLVVGAGEMGESVLRAVAGRPRTLIANRTPERAAELAAAAGADAVAWEQLHDALGQADVVVSSTGSTAPVLGEAEVAALMAGRPDRPLLVVDLAVPRDVDPGAAGIDGVTLLDMDAVRAHADLALAARREELPRAERIVAESVAAHLEASAQRQMAPMVTRLRERAEEIRQGELARLDGRLNGLDDAQRSAVEALSRGIVAKLLHDPTIRLKSAAGTPEGEQLAAALRELFEL